MPDVWTTNPETLRVYLRESGSLCGVPGRVLPGRDPEWTCTFDSKGVIRDVYIHALEELYFTPPVSALFVVVSGVGVLIGAWLLLGKRPRLAWLSAALLMFLLMFGKTVLRDFPTVADNWQYLLICLIGAALTDSEK